MDREELRRAGVRSVDRTHTFGIRIVRYIVRMYGQEVSVTRSAKRRREAADVRAALDPDEKPKRKNHYLYQSKIDMARSILGVKTETEALDGALDLLIYGESMARGTEEMAGEEYVDVLGIGGEVSGTGGTEG
ncbi:MAG: hypothetical protein WD995_00010 [Gemmatimonadota bacterium]